MGRISVLYQIIRTHFVNNQSSYILFFVKLKYILTLRCLKERGGHLFLREFFFFFFTYSTTSTKLKITLFINFTLSPGAEIENSNNYYSCSSSYLHALMIEVFKKQFSSFIFFQNYHVPLLDNVLFKFPYLNSKFLIL